MRVNKIYSVSIVILLVIGVYSFVHAGNETTSPNPTGGFGQGTSTTSNSGSPNPVGGFGGSDPMPLSDTPPPPPPVPVPLDGGVGLLIAATLGLGIKKIYGEVNKK